MALLEEVFCDACFAVFVIIYGACARLTIPEDVFCDACEVVLVALYSACAQLTLLEEMFMVLAFSWLFL